MGPRFVDMSRRRYGWNPTAPMRYGGSMGIDREVLIYG
jgi:hypothetical protein